MYENPRKSVRMHGYPNNILEYLRILIESREISGRLFRILYSDFHR